MPDYPIIHPRVRVVNQARNKLSGAICEWAKEHEGDLTDAEFIRIISVEMNDWIGTCTKHMIKAERHPDDPDKPGGFE